MRLAPRDRGPLRYRRSLASRVILLTTIAVGLSVAVVALAAYVTVRHQLQATMDKSLKQRALSSAQYNPENYAVGSVPQFVEDANDSKAGYLYSSGRAYTTSGASDDRVQLGRPELAVAKGTRQYSCRTVYATSGTAYRVAAVPTRMGGVAFVLAQSLEPNEETLDRLRLVLLLFGAAGVLAAALAGWGVARNGLRPVRRLTHAAEEVARTERLDPIDVEGNDEIARLARSFNAMLAALSASRDRQRQLVADAGHELRTPLTSLRTNLDLLTQADRQGGLSEASRTELLDDVRFQIEELTQLIGDLTELARDQPPKVLLEDVDLVEIIERAVQRVRRRASSLQFDLHTEPWWVLGDASALERAVTNLLDNAAKWSPPLGVVTVALTGPEDERVLTVSDQGRGIAEEDRPHVFDRFYRSKDARTMPGSGLGLSIVSQVAERHGGEVGVGAAPDGGALFWLRVPGSAHSGSPASSTAETLTGGPDGPGASGGPRATQGDADSHAPHRAVTGGSQRPLSAG